MIELLAPAGNLETLETALYFGADAIYMAGKQYGLQMCIRDSDGVARPRHLAVWSFKAKGAY